jgi:hypothetical protein
MVGLILILYRFWCFLSSTLSAHSCISTHTLLLQAKQLKDYENAVIAKRLEELDDDEIQALVEEIERDEF